MGIHSTIYKVVHHRLDPAEMKGKHVALDVASFKARAFRNDAPSHYRPARECDYGFKAQLARLFSSWCVATGAPSNLHVVLDGARFPLKAATNADRAGHQSYEERLAEGIAFDDAGDAAQAEKCYKELSMVACPPLVDAWIIAHCQKYGITLHVAPCEADSMCAKLHADGDVDAIISYDGDLGIYKGVTHFIVADSSKQGTYWSVYPEKDIVGAQVGKLNLQGWTTYDLRTIAGAAGTDYLARVHGVGWAGLAGTLNGLITQSTLLGEPVRKDFDGEYAGASLEGTVRSFSRVKGFNILYVDDDSEDVDLATLLTMILPETRRVAAGTLVDEADYKLGFGSELLRSRFVSALGEKNAKLAPQHQIANYEKILWLSYDAFEDPVSWVRVSDLDQAWTTQPMDAARLVGARSLLYDEVGVPYPSVQPLVTANAAIAARLCQGLLHPRLRVDCAESDHCQPLDKRLLPILSEVAEGEDEVNLPIIKPSERKNQGLKRYSKNALVTWLSDKLGCPVSPESKGDRSVLESCVSCVLEIMEKEGATHLASMCATMGALHSWTVDCGKLDRRVDERITHLHTIYDYACTHLPVIDDDLRHRYMPQSFHSTYERAFALFAGGSIRMSSLCIIPASLSHNGKDLNACAVSANVGASQREGGNKLYLSTIGFVLNEHSRGWVLHSPDSDCTCPCGVACAHGLDLLHCLSRMQRASSFEDFVATCPKFDEATATSSRVIFWDTVLFYSARYAKQTAVMTAAASAAATVGGALGIASGFAIATVIATNRTRSRTPELSDDQKLAELEAAGDAVHPETGRQREVHAQFGDAKLFEELDELFALDLPEFSDPAKPLCHYSLWYARQMHGPHLPPQPTAPQPTAHPPVQPVEPEPQTDATPPPTEPPEPQMQPPSKKACPKGHLLSGRYSGASRHLMLSCDGACGKAIMPYAKRWSCTPCDYDVCDTCA